MTRLVVAKLGGNAALESVPEVVEMARRAQVCVVHGGGAQISALARARGIEPRFVAGRRFTDLETLDCVREGLAAVTAGLCAALQGAGLAPAAFVDGVIAARRVPELGFVGEPCSVRVDELRFALGEGLVPVIGPLGNDDTGTVLNINADDSAAAIASALAADELVFLSDVPGVLDDQGEVLSHISASRPPASASGGMLPKLEACTAALLGGVARVSIGAAGTVVTP
ncbi:MAG: acetylglutamate kinase [Gaiellales bacterium]|jgi:acetylglutamate kinase|nr:acetylglutamate kinase [Gaiellales bacterium]